MNFKKTFNKIIAAVLLNLTFLSTFLNTNFTFAIKPQFTKDDIAILKKHEEERLSKLSELLFKDWPELTNVVDKNVMIRKFEKLYKKSLEFRRFLYKNQKLISYLYEVYKKIYDISEDSDEDSDEEGDLDLTSKSMDTLLKSKSRNILLCHPVFFQAAKEEKLSLFYGEYQHTIVCDEIQAFLRGDATINWGGHDLKTEPKESRLPATWGTSLLFTPDQALSRIECALALRQDLSHHKSEEITLYRGICLPKVLDSISKDDGRIIEEAVQKIISGASDIEDFSGENIIYRAKDISSTSKDMYIARRFALNVWERSTPKVIPVILKINVRKGTASGKYLRVDTEEIALKPGQKMKINSAEKIPYESYRHKGLDYFIILTCETIAD